MKKIFTTFLLISTLALVPTTPVSAAETIDLIGEFELMDPIYEFESMETEAPGGAAIIKPCPRGTFRVRRKTRTKKKLLNAAVTSGIGAAVGAGVAGKRGAAIGAGTGAGGYLTYRWVRDRRGRCVRQYRR